MISRIEAYRYRCFSKLAVELGAYNVLAGANGSGKTTLLDVPVLFGDLLTERVCRSAFLEKLPSRETPRAQTLTELIHQGRGDEFIIALEATLPRSVGNKATWVTDNRRGTAERWRPSGLRYEVRFQVFNQTELHVLNEYLYLYSEKHRPELGGGLQGEAVAFTKSGRPKLQKRDWRTIIHRERGNPAQFKGENPTDSRVLDFRVPPAQLAFANLPYDDEVYPSAIWLHDLLREDTVFYEPDGRELRRASAPGQGHQVIPSGRNLAWLILELQKQDAERFSDWVDHVRTALPQVKAISAVEREEDHHAYVVVDYEGGYQVTSSGLSDGTLRILAFTVIPYLSKHPQVLVTEEPENGVHPQAIEAVLQSLTSVYDGQVWISTHSPIVLAHTELSRVICARMNDNGSVEVIPGDQHPRLKDWKGSLDLGTLFAAGVLG